MAEFIELNEFDNSIINIDAIEQIENVKGMIDFTLRIWFVSGSCRDFYYGSRSERDEDFKRIIGGCDRG